MVLELGFELDLDRRLCFSSSLLLSSASGPLDSLLDPGGGEPLVSLKDTFLCRRILRSRASREAARSRRLALEDSSRSWAALQTS